MPIDPGTILHVLPKPGGREVVLLRRLWSDGTPRLEITVAQRAPDGRFSAVRGVGIGPDMLQAFAEAAPRRRGRRAGLRACGRSRHARRSFLGLASGGRGPMSDDLHLRGIDDAPAFARTMAEALASGREFAVWIESDAGDERLAYSIRLDGGAYRLRDGDLSDAGTFADVGAAMRAAGRMMEERI